MDALRVFCNRLTSGKKAQCQPSACSAASPFAIEPLHQEEAWNTFAGPAISISHLKRSTTGLDRCNSGIVNSMDFLDEKLLKAARKSAVIIFAVKPA
jgi:hypothetical protein